MVARYYEGILTLVGNGFIHTENLLTTDRPKVSVPTTGRYIFWALVVVDRFAFDGPPRMSVPTAGIYVLGNWEEGVF